MICEFGVMKRLPGVPAAVSTEAMEAAMPMQTVDTSQRMNCMAS